MGLASIETKRAQYNPIVYMFILINPSLIQF